MRTVRIVLCTAVLVLAGGTHAWAQQSRIVGSDELSAAVLDRASTVEQERAALGAVLERGDVAEIAQRNGIDIERVRESAAALSAEDLRRVTPLVQSLAAELAGGQTLTITATTLIIILLLVILIIVAT